MSGVSATVVGLGLAGGVAIVLFGAAGWFLIPIGLMVAVVVVAGPVLRFITERGQPGTDEPGVPSTREASYEPVEPRRPS